MPEPLVDALDEEIAGLVYQLGAAMGEYFDRHVREMDVGLTGRQALVLWMAQVNAPLTMGGLARILHLDPSSVTGLVARLEAKGLVRRAAHPDDRRGTLIEVTATGRQLHRRLEKRLVAARPSIKRMSQQEKRTLRDLLARALEGL